MADERGSETRETAEEAVEEVQEAADRVEEAATIDERGSETGETTEEAVEEVQEAADRVRVEEAATIAADEAIDTSDQATEGQVVFSETTVVDDVEAGDEYAIPAVEELPVESSTEDLQETVPDLEPIAFDEPAEELLAAAPAGADDYASATSEDEYVVIEQTESVVTEIDEGASTVPEDELLIVGPADVVVAEAAVSDPTVGEPETVSEGFTTLQALILAILVLLNVIVISLGIWQLSLYFGLL